MAGLVYVTSFLVLLELALSSDFRGGTAQWRPLDNDPINFDGTVSEHCTAE